MGTNSCGVKAMTTMTVRELQINYRIWNEEAKETLVLLHGFTGSIATWKKVISFLPSTFKILAIDLIGHGKTDSPIESSRYHMKQQVNDLEDLFSQLNLDSFNLLGYSMGGRVALSYASAYPHRIKRLILESSSPGLKTSEEREARRKADENLADQIEQNGIEAFVEKWENIPLFSSQKKLPFEVQQAIREERLSQSEKGLANSLRGMGTGAQESVWPQLNQLKFPVILITGALDLKFCDIAQKMKKHLAEGKHVLVENVGHAIHVENPKQFATIVKDEIIKTN